MVATEAKTFNLRIPPELRVWLEEEAKRNMRSLNSEIVFKLAQSRANGDADGGRNERQRPV